MPLQISDTDPGWPDTELSEPFQAIQRAQNTTPATVTDVTESGAPIAFPEPEEEITESNTEINTASFVASDASSDDCDLPPYEPVSPPPEEDDEGDLPIDWNPPVIIDDPVVPIPIGVTVKANDVPVCVNATEIPTLTQTENPVIGGTHGSPTIEPWNQGDPDWESGIPEVGDSFKIIPGVWTPPDDGNEYVIKYQNGTLSVIYCDDDCGVVSDCKVVGIYALRNPTSSDRDSDGRYYYVDDSTGYAFINDGTIPDQDSFIHGYTYLCVAVALDPKKNDFMYKNFGVYQNGVYIGTLTPTAENKISTVSNILIDPEWIITDTEKTFEFEIREEDGENNENFGYKKKFSITAKMTGCGVAIVDNQRVRCPHYFEHVNGTSKLWAGTAVWNK